MIRSCILPKHNRSLIFRTKLWDSKKVLKWNLQKQCGKAWTGIHLDQDRDKWRTFVNTVRDLQASVNAVNFLTNWETFRFWRRTALRGISYNIHADVNNSFNWNSSKILGINKKENVLFGFIARKYERNKNRHSVLGNTDGWELSRVRHPIRTSKKFNAKQGNMIENSSLIFDKV